MMQGVGELVTAAKNAVVALGQIAKQLSTASVGFGPPVTTVGALPLAAANAGKLFAVTDAAAPTYGAILAGGGAIYALALSDGVHWRSH